MVLMLLVLNLLFFRSCHAGAEEATRVWLNEVGLELPGKFTSDSVRMKKIRQLTDVGRFLNRLLGEVHNQIYVLCC